MRFAQIQGVSTRRSHLSAADRRTARSRRPLVEQVEARELLSNVPLMLINSPKVVEGTDGSTTLNFTVSLSGPSDRPVSVDYQTAGLTAKSGDDFTATGGTLTFDPGETSKAIP